MKRTKHIRVPEPGTVLLAQRTVMDSARDFGALASVVFGSPPYPGKAKRYDGVASYPNKWDEWGIYTARVMAKFVKRGCDWCAFVVNDGVKDGVWDCAVSKLEVTLREWNLNLEHTLIWDKNATPNRGRNYFQNAHEKIVVLRGNGERYFNWKASATPMKYKSGGDFRQRSNTTGQRTKGGKYPKGELAGPRDLARFTVGGGHMGEGVGDKFATAGFAPFPESLVYDRLPPFARPGCCVLDCFCGSGTTAVVAAKLGYSAIATDVDMKAIESAYARCKAMGIPVKVLR